MTYQHPQNEPVTPPPGWYPDPVTGVGLRWWDGTGWTDQTTVGQVTGQTPGTGLRPAGEWISASLKLVTSRAGHIFPLIVLLSVVPGIAVAVTLYFALRGLVLVAEPSFNAQSIESFSIEGLEAGRFVPMVGAIVVSIVCGVILATATTLHLARAAADSPERWDDSLRRSLRRWPRVLGVSILVGLTLLLALLIIGVVWVVAGTVIWPVLLLLVPLGIAALIWIAIRVSLATTTAALAPRGVGSIGHSAKLTDGRAWSLFGRFCLLGLIVVGFQLAVNLVSAPFAATASNPTELEGSRLEMVDLFSGSLPVLAFQQLVGVLAGGVVTALLSAGLVVLYRDLGGEQAD